MSLRLTLALAFTLSASLAAGCYEENCVTTQDDRGLAEPAPGIRNPFTGQCEFYGGGGGGGGGCGDFGGRSNDSAADQAPIPDWGICNGFCESLMEADCLQAEECRGVYSDPCLGGDVQCELGEPIFYQCWALTPGGGFSEEGCNTYEADECSRHNECSAVHSISDGGSANGELGVFGICINEPGPIDPGSCEAIAECPTPAPVCPQGTLPGVAQGCWTGFCIPLDQCDGLSACSARSESQCVGRADCEPLYEGIDCVCDGEDCVCAEWVFESCS